MDTLTRKARQQFELRRRGISQTTIARKAGVSVSTVSKVLAETYPALTAEGQATVAKVRETIRTEIAAADAARGTTAVA